MPKKSTTRTAVYNPPVNASFADFDSVNIRLPIDMDVFRVHIQLSPFDVISTVISDVPFLLVSGQNIANASNGFRLYPRIIYDGVSYLYSASDPLILDRRGTDSVMRDDLHVALYYSSEDQIQFVCNVIFEGYIK